jgi:ubiquinol-cytochrome c reductase cytochrome c1 subunit
MKKLLLSLFVALSFCGPVQAAGGGHPWDKFPTERMNDLAALQNGAKLFSNYCLNCHAAAFMRYNRLKDIGLSDEQVAQNLIFTGAKVGETMKIAQDPADAKVWFGADPPDLTLIARSRADASKGSGADYIYTYLRTYYRDETKPTGWNNLAFPGIGMPHVLWELQGQQRAAVRRREGPARSGQADAGLQGLRAHHARQAECRRVQPCRGRSGGLYEMDERTHAGPACAPGCVGVAVPGGVHRDRLAPECGVLEGHQVRTSRPGPVAGRACGAVGSHQHPLRFVLGRRRPAAGRLK